jgi:peptidoglycan/LPS O-acetylase OafA/YrhL
MSQLDSPISGAGSPLSLSALSAATSSGSQEATSAQAGSPQATSLLPERGFHIAPLDGLRGMAALYVVFHHAHRLCLDASGSDASLPRSLARPMKVFAYGRCAVVLFIVLSGFVLMMPVVQAADHRLRGGIKDYLKRRARRILPPYYFALALTLLLIAVQPLALYKPDGAVDRGTVVSHLLMVHNLKPAWNHAINTPMWSVATEWDIYFVFPLLLLPVWRRFGVGSLVAVGAVLAVVPQMFGVPFIDWAAPWFVLLFALGMAAAAVSCNPALTPARRQVLRRWSGIGAVLLVPLFLGCYELKSVIYGRWPVWYHLAADITFGLDSTCLIIFCATQPRRAEQEQGQRVSPVVRLAQSGVAVGLGRFSYSLYLVHWPILVLAHGWMDRLGFSVHATAAAMLLMTVPAVAIAYGFYLLFERPFLAVRKVREMPAGTPLASEPRSGGRATAIVNFGADLGSAEHVPGI